ncbi:energy transducer TonB [Anabaena azotica]|uniref:energy transducer TonB n=1 Tax=Anabaena azotica TaxID=197653 RepID=UPI0039A45B72
MGFYSVVLKQRKKESEALKSFLLFSFIGSLALHISILALLGISKFLQKISQPKDQPIEITIIENVPQQITPQQEIQKSSPKINSGGGGGGRSGSNNNAKNPISAQTPSSTPIVKQPQPKTTHSFIFKKPQTPTVTKLATTALTEKPTPIQKTTPELTTKPPIEKFSEKLDTPATTQPTSEQTEIPNTKPSNVEAPKLTTLATFNSNTNSRTLSSGNNSGTLLGNRLKNSFNKGTGNGNGAGNGIGNGNGAGNGTGNGNGAGNGTGNGVGNEIENKPKKEETPVATAPKPPKENGSKLNRADCIRCDIKYPDKARRRGIEGQAEVALDTDANGIVTFVRLIRSSGDNELDEAAQQAAQEWKLKPTDGGRQGVRASVNFAIKGSQRHRQLQKRQRKRQTGTESPKPNLKITTPIVTPETPAPSATNTPESNQNSENSN